MKILLTGDNGRLGTRTRTQLEGYGHEVIGYDVKDGFDIGDLEGLTTASQGCDVIIHLAAIPHPQKGHMSHYFKTNVEGTMNVLRAAEANKVNRVVYTSSTGYYGTDTNIHGYWRPLYLPIDERHPPLSAHGQFYGPLMAYNQSKVMAEQLLAWYGTNRRVQTVTLRIAPANSKAEQYSKGDPGYLAKNDWRLVSLLANCHPDCAASALALAADLDLDLPWWSAYNIVDRYLPAKFTPQMAYALYGVETDRSLFSIEKAERVLGWEPCEDR